jgi:hypothetical protein
MSGGLYGTNWSLETSEETSVSVFTSVSTGKLSGAALVLDRFRRARADLRDARVLVF